MNMDRNQDARLVALGRTGSPRKLSGKCFYVLFCILSTVIISLSSVADATTTFSSNSFEWVYYTWIFITISYFVLFFFLDTKNFRRLFLLKKKSNYKYCLQFERFHTSVVYFRNKKLRFWSEKNRQCRLCGSLSRLCRKKNWQYVCIYFCYKRKIAN